MPLMAFGANETIARVSTKIVRLKTLPTLFLCNRMNSRETSVVSTFRATDALVKQYMAVRTRKFVSVRAAQVYVYVCSALFGT